MRKFGMILATMLMVVSLAACSKSLSGITGSSSSSGYASSNSGSSSSSVNTGNMQSKNPSTGYIEGDLGDKMSTAWFDFTVESATLCAMYDGYSSNPGYQFLVMDVSLKNTFNEAVPMYDSDFDVEWDDPDSFELPLWMTVNGEELTEEEYMLPYHGSADITMIFEVPEGVEDFIVYFDEYYEDDTAGEVFAVYFTPEQE